ncbi:MAG: hypothetical protein MUC50_17660 [Myxococcota bacterium]|jgi:hypothetical protein|nr:hypothetical protein [Myxococcota bacterium]
MGKIIREDRAKEAALEDELLRIARGETVPEDRLRELMDQEDLDPAALAQICAPLDKSFEDKAVATITSAMARPAQISNTAQNHNVVVDLTAFKARRRATVGAVVAVIGLAASVLLVFGIVNRAPMPQYELSIIGGEKAFRGEAPPADDSGAPLQLSQGAALELILRPKQATTEEYSARAYLVKGSRIVPIEASFERAEGGAIRIFAVAGEHFQVGAGQWELQVFLGPDGELPNGQEVARNQVGQSVAVFRRDIIVL